MIGLIIAMSIMALMFLLIDFEGAIGNFAVALIIVLTPIIAKAIAMGPANRFEEEIGLKQEDYKAALKR